MRTRSDTDRLKTGERYSRSRINRVEHEGIKKPIPAGEVLPVDRYLLMGDPSSDHWCRRPASYRRIMAQRFILTGATFVIYTLQQLFDRSPLGCEEMTQREKILFGLLGILIVVWGVLYFVT